MVADRLITLAVLTATIAEVEDKLGEARTQMTRAERDSARHLAAGNRTRHPALRDSRMFVADLEAQLRGLRELAIYTEYTELGEQIHQTQVELETLRPEMIQLAHTPERTGQWSTRMPLSPEPEVSPTLTYAAALGAVQVAESKLSRAIARHDLLWREYAPLIEMLQSELASRASTDV